MKAEEILTRVQNDFKRLTKLPVGGVIGISREQGTWVVTLEALERRGIPDTMDILGLYEVHMSEDGETQSIRRLKLRKRGDTEE